MSLFDELATREDLLDVEWFVAYLEPVADAAGGVLELAAAQSG